MCVRACVCMRVCVHACVGASCVCVCVCACVMCACVFSHLAIRLVTLRGLDVTRALCVVLFVRGREAVVHVSMEGFVCLCKLCIQTFSEVITLFTPDNYTNVRAELSEL